jgi:hypothetical protein
MDACSRAPLRLDRFTVSLKSSEVDGPEWNAECGRFLADYFADVAVLEGHARVSTHASACACPHPHAARRLCGYLRVGCVASCQSCTFSYRFRAIFH